MKTPFPFMRFFPSDWLSDEALRLVGFAARGLWIDMLCLMAKSEQRGYLTLKGGVIPTVAQIAKMVGSTELEITPLLQELKDCGVYSVDENGAIFSRRLKRDTEAYRQAVKDGKKGGNPSLKAGDNRGGYPPLDIASKLIASGSSSESEAEKVISKCPLQLRAEALLRKRPTTPWSKAELTAWKTAKAIVADTTEMEWADLAAWFALPVAPYRRQGLSTLLNNWQDEILRARLPENLALIAAAPDAADLALGVKQRAAF